MELGAVVCTVGEPRCGECPVAAACLGRREADLRAWPFISHPPARAGSAGASAMCAVCDSERPEAAVLAVSPAKYPLRPLKRAAVPAAWTVAAALQRACGGGGSEVLLVRRPPSGLLAGQLDLPSAPVGEHASPAARRAALAEHLASAFGIALPPAARCIEVGPVVHVFSSLRLSVTVVACRLDAREAGELDAWSGGGVQWTTAGALAERGATALLTKLLAAASEGELGGAGESDDAGVVSQ